MSPVLSTEKLSYQPRMVKPNSNELDHCLSAVLHSKSKRLDGSMRLPAAGEISGKHWDKTKRVNEMLKWKLKKPVASLLRAQVRAGGGGV